MNKRPDSREIFLECGKRLAFDPSKFPRIVLRLFTTSLAKRRVARCLRQSFGRRIGGFSGSGLTLECRSHLFMEMDPTGNACALISGIVLESSRSLGATGIQVEHTSCESLGDTFCRWDIQGM